MWSIIQDCIILMKNNTKLKDGPMGKTLLLTIILLMTAVISTEGFEKTAEMIRPIFDRTIFYYREDSLFMYSFLWDSFLHSGRSFS